MPLTPKRQRYAEALVANGGNQTQAAIAAGYAESGAHTEGSRLLRNAEVASEVDRVRRSVVTDTDVDPAYVVTALARLYEDAHADRAYGAATQAANSLAKILGLHVVRVSVDDVRARSRAAAIDAGLDPDEVEREALRLLAPND